MKGHDDFRNFKPATITVVELALLITCLCTYPFSLEDQILLILGFRVTYNILLSHLNFFRMMQIYLKNSRLLTTLQLWDLGSSTCFSPDSYSTELSLQVTSLLH